MIVAKNEKHKLFPCELFSFQIDNNHNKKIKVNEKFQFIFDLCAEQQAAAAAVAGENRDN